MGNRRKFFRQAGAMAAAPLAVAVLPGAGAAEVLAQAVSAATTRDAIVIENAEMRLLIGVNGRALSLIHKATGQECLAPELTVPMFTVTQYRPYDNELQLAYPAKVTPFPGQSVRREGDQLIVSFPLVGYEATIDLKITDAYFGFTLRKLEYKGFTSLTHKYKTPIDETLFLQLPVRARRNFGDWLNVTWDDQVAVNVLATDPYARIDAVPCSGNYLFQAGTVDDIATEGVGAALITTSTSALLDRIAKVEEDFDLPRGVESRRCREYRFSYYEAISVTPNDIDAHIKLAKQAGFRTMVVYYLSFAQTVGHFEWRPEFPNQMDDLRAMVKKISDAGMIPGIHIHYNKTHKTDAYVTPQPDPRLNVRHRYTLAKPVDAAAAAITVEENPRTCTLDNARRILKLGNELVEYQRYSTQPPYQFLDCRRGALKTQPDAHPVGSVAGELDVDTWPVFVRFTQNTSIQDEVAERLRKIYHDAGFKFTYFDGAEDTPMPYWFTVSRAQWRVYEKLDPKPLFSEGACKSHFSWHILTRGNAFDTFKPEVIKAATRAYPAAEAPRVAKDFTSINFGWIGYWAPGAQTIGTQPDMLEYVTSRAAAWDCPISMNGPLDQFRGNARTPDNLEVIKRWEDARASGWLSQGQKEALKDVNQEHTLLINESSNMELVPYSQIENIAGADRPARGFIFERAGKVYVTYWHISGEAELDVPLPPRSIRLLRDLGATMKFRSAKQSVRLPLAGKLYVECTGLSVGDVAKAFQKGEVIGS